MSDAEVRAQLSGLEARMRRLETLLGAPCTLIYAAEVSWPSQQEIGSLPDGGTPPATIIDRTDAGLVRFGKRQPGDLRQCSPDDMLRQWYSRQ